jgi:hypothetical protein
MSQNKLKMRLGRAAQAVLERMRAEVLQSGCALVDVETGAALQAETPLASGPILSDPPPLSVAGYEDYLSGPDLRN